MNNPDFLKYVIMGVGGALVLMAIAYYIIYKKLNSKETRYVASLVQGTKSNTFSMEVFYQKFYIYIVRNNILLC